MKQLGNEVVHITHCTIVLYLLSILKHMCSSVVDFVVTDVSFLRVCGGRERVNTDISTHNVPMSTSLQPHS